MVGPHVAVRAPLTAARASSLSALLRHARFAESRQIARRLFELAIARRYPPPAVFGVARELRNGSVDARLLFSLRRRETGALEEVLREKLGEARVGDPPSFCEAHPRVLVHACDLLVEGTAESLLFFKGELAAPELCQAFHRTAELLLSSAVMLAIGDDVHPEVVNSEHRLVADPLLAPVDLLGQKAVDVDLQALRDGPAAARLFLRGTSIRAQTFLVLQTEVDSRSAFIEVGEVHAARVGFVEGEGKRRGRAASAGGLG